MGSSTAGFPFLSSFFPPSHCFRIEIAFKQGTFAKDVTTQSSGALPWFDMWIKAGVNLSSLWRRRGKAESQWQWSSRAPGQIFLVVTSTISQPTPPTQPTRFPSQHGSGQCYYLSFPNGKTEIFRDSVTCPGSPKKPVAELGLDLGAPQPLPSS